MNGKAFNGLEDTLDGMGMVGKIGCDVVPIDVPVKLGISNVKGPILLCENRMDELNYPIGVDVKGVNTVIS